MAYAVNADEYQKKPLETNEQKINAALKAAKEPILHPLKDMAMVDPCQRASAAQMLDKLFGGEGRTTTSNLIYDGSSFHPTPTTLTTQL